MALKRPEERLYAVACGAMVVFGIILSLPGTVVGLPEAAAQFDLSLANRGGLISTLFAGMLAGCIVGGPIVDRAGQRRALTVSTAVAGLSMMLFAVMTTFTAAAVTLTAMGVGCAGMNISANALSSDLFPDDRVRRMNGIAVMVGIGGLLLPAAMALITALLSWRSVVSAAGVVALLVAASAARVPAPRYGRSQEQDLPYAAGDGRSQEQDLPYMSGDWRKILGQRGLTTVGALVLLGAANENTMAGWTSTYLNDQGFSARTATWVLASHWSGLIIGRMILSTRLDTHKIGAIVVCALAGAAFVTAFVGAPVPFVLASAPFAIGTVIGVVIPTSLALGGERLKGNAGTLFGLLLTLAQVGGMTAPAVVGLAAERYGLRMALTLMAANSLAIAAIAWRAGRR
jgi:MFS transporter, FHS family, glucose/mannose:H+ symporter